MLFKQVSVDPHFIDEKNGRSEGEVTYSRSRNQGARWQQHTTGCKDVGDHVCFSPVLKDLDLRGFAHTQVEDSVFHWWAFLSDSCASPLAQLGI